MASPFKLTTQFEPKGDQPQAIQQLMKGLEDNEKHQVLLGITGSGKTFTVANVIAKHGKPALLYDLKCAGSQAYLRLASEVIQREGRVPAAA